VSVGGEVAADGSLFARAQTSFSRLGFDTYVRKQLGRVGSTDHGVTIGHDLWKGVTLRGTVRTSTSTLAGVDSSDWRLLSVRIPLGRGANVGFEHTWLETDRNDVSGSAAVVHVPAGPFRIFQRYQWGQSAYKLRERPVGFDQKQMQTMASYQAARWLSLNYEVSTEWFEDGRASQWDELRSSFQLRRRTSLEVITAMPKVLESSRFRFRLNHQLRPRLYVLAEYGRISAFRAGPEMATERPRFLISVRKEWSVPTPAGGGSLGGWVQEPNGDPVPGVVVRLGPYRDVTDARGSYLFKNLPTGSLEFSLEAETLPANYAYAGGRETINITRSTRAIKKVSVVPLQSITGRVFCDENRNGRFDEGEQQRAIVMSVESTLTTSDGQGRYGFFNLPPGHYVVRLDTQRLPAGFKATHDSATVQLDSGSAATGIDFVLVKVDKPVILKELP
jgi:hypothetical protein